MICVVVQTLSYESWEYNMWNNIDSEYQYASIYYILFILMGPLLLLNVFVAGISSVFLKLRRENQVRLLTLHLPSVSLGMLSLLANGTVWW